MSFTTLDGIEVYAADEVYNKPEIEEKLSERDIEINSLKTKEQQDRNNINEIGSRVTNLEDTRATKSALANEKSRIDTHDTKIYNLEQEKADKSQVATQVSREIDSVISTKVQQVANQLSDTINSRVISAVQGATADLATKAELNDKPDTLAVSGLISDRLSGYSDTAAVSGMIAGAVSGKTDTLAVSGLISDRLSGYSDTAAVSSMIADALSGYQPSGQSPSIEAMTALEIQNVVDQNF